MTQEQFIQISNWQKETFVSATALSKLKHLEKELIELIIETVMPSDADGKNKALEYADCFFLLFGAAAADGMTYQDICDAIDKKFQINKQRKCRVLKK